MPSSEQWTPEAAVPPALKERLDSLHDSQAPAETYLVAFLEIANLLKKEERTGWVDRNIPRPESVSDHMYRMGLMGMLTTNKSLDMSLCIRIALVHDLAEALVGDIPPYSDVSKQEKSRREHATITYLRDLLRHYNSETADMVYDLWCQYEYQRSPEAAFVKDVDKLELLCQADDYARQHPSINLQEFQSVLDLIKTPEVKKWAQGLKIWSGKTGLYGNETK